MGFGFIRSILAVYRNYYEFGQVLLDKTATMAGFRTKFTFDFEGEDYLRKMASANTGCLLISAHIGNFEMAGHLLERLQSRVNILMLDAEHQHIKQYLNLFTRKSFQVIPIRKDNSHVYDIKRVLENKEILCMHGDRFVKGSKNMECMFLGEKARFPHRTILPGNEIWYSCILCFCHEGRAQALPFLCHIPTELPATAFARKT